MTSLHNVRTRFRSHGHQNSSLSFRCEQLERRDLLTVVLNHVGTYSSGHFDNGGAEIVAHDAQSQRLLVTNTGDKSVDVLDISTLNSNPNPTFSFRIDTTPFGVEPTGIAVHEGLIAVSVRNELGGAKGSVALFESDGTLIKMLEAGYGPDMITFTPDGSSLLVANQGRPTDDYLTDQAGSISIVDLSNGAAAATIAHIGFEMFDGMEDSLRAKGVRIFGPILEETQNSETGELEISRIGTAPPSIDLEPENIAVSPDSRTAWITLQENNAIAKLDIATQSWVDIKGLGFIDHSLPGNELDTSDVDGEVRIESAPIRGMFQPDGIAVYMTGETLYLLTANEGNSRDLDTYNEESLLRDLVVSEELSEFQAADRAGRLKVSNDPPTGKMQNDANETVYNHIYSFGTRSFSVWSADMDLVADSGSGFERAIAARDSQNFNANDANRFTDGGLLANFDNRSDDKGPEPEAVAVGNVAGKTVAFVGLERVGGVMIYDVSVPESPQFESYMNHRDFGAPNTIIAGETETLNPDVGDLAAEGVVFISAADSPTGVPLLVTANEVSGTTSVFSIVDLSGNFDGDDLLTAADIDFVFQQSRSGAPDLRADLNGDMKVNESDRDRWVLDIAKTSYGDANLDGVFDSSDLSTLFQAGEYEDDTDDNSTWATGDYDGDGEFTSSDLVFLFQRGRYLS